MCWKCASTVYSHSVFLHVCQTQFILINNALIEWNSLYTVCFSGDCACYCACACARVGVLYFSSSFKVVNAKNTSETKVC